MKSQRIFVTGGTGFIGSYLLPKLVEHGYQVTVLTRSQVHKAIPDRPALPAEVRLVQGDLCSPETYRHALNDQQALIHLAADYRVGLPRHSQYRRDMYRTNVTGTLMLFDEAEKAAIPHRVHVSSTAALGETYGQFPDENHLHNGHFRSYYEETKHIAHSLLHRQQQQGLPINIAIPGGVFGAGDNSVLTQTIKQFFLGKLPFQIATSSTFQLCHVSCLCDGLLKLLSPEIQRKNYLFTGKDFSMPEIIQQLATISQRPVPAAKSVNALKPLAWLMDKLAAFGLTMPLSCETLAVLDNSTYMYSSAKAIHDLNWSAGSPEQAFADYATALWHTLSRHNHVTNKKED